MSRLLIGMLLLAQVSQSRQQIAGSAASLLTPTTSECSPVRAHRILTKEHR